MTSGRGNVYLETSIQAAAPLDRIPLYVRAGSILPMGPEIEYARERPGAPIELRIYRGADGSFTLYEDQGDTYAYEQGAYATIPIRWGEATNTLAIGRSSGAYPGMPKHTFRIVWVSTGHGNGSEVVTTADVEVVYSGQEVEIKAPDSPVHSSSASR